jgi:hypothetical protein
MKQLLRTAILLTAAQLSKSADQQQLTTTPDIFSSVTELSRLMGREKDFMAGLDQLAHKLETSAKIIRDFHKVSPCFKANG